MKKKLGVIAAILCALALLSAGTLAYFTAQSDSLNQITMGNVKIALVEKTLVDNGDGTTALADFPRDGLTGMMPGVSASKQASVKNTGDNPCWVRVKLEASIVAADGETKLPLTLTGGGEAVLIDIAQTGMAAGAWTVKTQQDGYYYYSGILAPGAETPLLFSEVTLNRDAGNEYQNCKIVVTVTAEAVQSAHNGSTVADAAGWPAS